MELLFWNLPLSTEIGPYLLRSRLSSRLGQCFKSRRPATRLGESFKSRHPATRLGQYFKSRRPATRLVLVFNLNFLEIFILEMAFNRSRSPHPRFFPDSVVSDSGQVRRFHGEGFENTPDYFRHHKRAWVRVWGPACRREAAGLGSGKYVEKGSMRRVMNPGRGSIKKYVTGLLSSFHGCIAEFQSFVSNKVGQTIRLQRGSFANLPNGPT